MLADGELDALVTARAPSTFYSEPDKVKRLFPDYVEAEKDYYRRTKIFPIMHTVVIRRDVYEKNPWVAQSLYKAFVAAKAKAMRDVQRRPPRCRRCCRGSSRTSRKRAARWATTGGPTASSRTATCSTPSCAITTSRACRSAASQPEELFAKETLETFKV